MSEKEAGAKVIHLLPRIRRKKQEETRSEPVAVLASKISQLLQEEDAHPLHQLAALGVAGKALRRIISDFHGEPVTSKFVKEAFYLSQKYEPEWPHRDHDDWRQRTLTEGKCSFCGQPVEKVESDGTSYVLNHKPDCPLAEVRW